jgi:hypothetical protein
VNGVGNQLFLRVTSEQQTALYTAHVGDTSTEFLYFDITESLYRVNTSYTNKVQHCKLLGAWLYLYYYILIFGA